jgi:hypothetical protein
MRKYLGAKMTNKISLKSYIREWINSDYDLVFEIKDVKGRFGIVRSTLSVLSLGTIVFKYGYEINSSNGKDRYKIIPENVKTKLYLPIDLRVVYGFNEKIDNEEIIEKLLDNDDFCDKFLLERNNELLFALCDLIESSEDNKTSETTYKVIKSNDVSSYADLPELRPVNLKVIKNFMSSLITSFKTI